MKRSVLSSVLAAGMMVGCGDGSGNPDAGAIDAPVTRGTMSLSWSLTDLDDNPLACEDVAALSISLQRTRQGSSTGAVDPFTCAAGSGTSAELDPGTYDVVVMVSALAGTLSEPQVLAPVEVVAGQNATIDPVVFQVDPVGNFSFNVDTGAAGGNCADEGAGGGALTALEIRLLDGEDICIPTTFVVGNETPPVTYVSDCQGSTTACVAKDVTFSVVGTTSGAHALEIAGTKNGLDCYSRTTLFTIPGNDLGRMLGNLILTLAPTPSCDPNAPDAGPTIDAGTVDAP